MTDIRRGMLIGIVIGQIGIIGDIRHWPVIAIIVLEVLAALGVAALLRDRPDRPL